MKKISVFFILVFTIQLATYSQGCLPNGISFSSQAEIDNFQTNYPGCTEIEGHVSISGNDITNVDGLSTITSIGGYLEIIYNPSLSNVTGLEGITSVDGYIALYYNDALTTLAGFKNLTTAGSHLEIVENPLLINLSGLESLVTVNEELIVAQNNALISLEGLSALTSVEMNLIIWGNPLLNSCESLSQLTTVSGVLQFNKNYALTSLSGLESLTTIGNFLTINENIELSSLEGLNNITSIGGKLHIRRNYKLQNLNGLSSLQTMNGLLLVEDNSELTSLNGIGNINPITIDSVAIFDNPMLSTCEVQSICNYISLPDALVNIHDNASGCNDIADVESACQAVNIGELLFSDYYSIYPIPAHDKLSIKTLNNAVIDNISLFNQYGQKVLSIENSDRIIDISGLISGLYIIEILNSDVKLRSKLIIK